jgi:NTP pyrophosphatase (non-canonical NTP hydrolase)
MKDFITHLLFCLSEEAGEVQQVIGKIGRFGFDDINPNTQSENMLELQKEITDLIAVYEMICERNGFNGGISSEAKENKKARVLKYAAYSVSRGELTSFT